MTKPNDLNVRNILSSYELYETWTYENSDVNVQLLFKVVDFTIDTVIDKDNYAGEVTYEIDTEYGGGPIEITTTYAVVEGLLEIEEELLDTNDLDWDVIDEAIALEKDNYVDSSELLS